MAYVKMTREDVDRIHRARKTVNMLKFKIHCAIRAKDQRTARLCISRMDRLKEEIYKKYEVILT